MLVLVAVATLLAGCAQLAQAPRLCLEQNQAITAGDTPALKLDQRVCVGPERAR